MSVIAFDPANRPIFSIPVRFDVEGHMLALSTYIETGKEYERLFDAFNQEHFDGALQYKLYVFAPQPGSFQSTLGIVIIAGFSALTATMLGDFGEGVLRGLTDKSASEWGVELGEKLGDLLDSDNSEEASTELLENAISTELLVITSERFLESRTRELVQVGFTPEEFPDSFSAKNAFYEALELNPQVSGIEFGIDPTEPVRRDEFSLRVAPVKTRDEATWEFETRKVFVTSPNWDQHDRQRGWKGRDSKGQTIFFTIYDPEFWERYNQGEVNSGTIDELVVQFAVKIENGRRKNRIVLNVISYNDDLFSKEIKQHLLFRRLESAGLVDSETVGPMLFE
ncbi:hypothetical protein [Aliiroseovarius marinus]|uniref:hypothetical protein n=1 Tax=Aliiroseovarius marinus TaxID=2500159 RepID=UPI002494E95D|nr:hypothetical protein [Aliiroseovarius marinus]